MRCVSYEETYSQRYVETCRPTSVYERHTLKSEAQLILNFSQIIYKNPVRTSQETRLRYKANPVNAVSGNSRCLS
jgi:hypothetical protein